MDRAVPAYTVGQAARLLGVSVDTVRRMADSGKVASRRTRGGHRVINGSALAQLATTLSEGQLRGAIVRQSARNRFQGIVTRVIKDRVSAQVELQAGPHRIVALMTREAADELELEIGVRAIASIKATSVVIEVPAR